MVVAGQGLSDEDEDPSFTGSSGNAVEQPGGPAWLGPPDLRGAFDGHGSHARPSQGVGEENQCESDEGYAQGIAGHLRREGGAWSPWSSCS